MCFSEIGEERFFGHFVPSVHKAFGMYHLINAFNFVKAWAGRCILAVQTLLLLFFKPRSRSGQSSTVCIGKLSISTATSQLCQLETGVAERTSRLHALLLQAMPLTCWCNGRCIPSIRSWNLVQDQVIQHTEDYCKSIF